MYQISKNTLAGKDCYTITSLESGNYFSVLAGYGGAINEFVVNGRPILLSARTPQDYERLTVASYAGNQLFPFPNRVNSAVYNHEGLSYVLPANDDDERPHSLHGLVYNIPFDLIENNEIEGRIVLRHLFRSIAGVYPFDMEITVSYTLHEDSLHVSTYIKNTGKQKAPMGHGWHPYIDIDGGIDCCQLQLPSSFYYLNNDALIPDGTTGSTEQFREFGPVGDLMLNHCFQHQDISAEQVTVIKYPTGQRINISQKGYEFTHYYIPPDRKSLAVEPQTCLTDAFNNNIGLIYLEPGQGKEMSFKITA